MISRKVDEIIRKHLSLFVTLDRTVKTIRTEAPFGGMEVSDAKRLKTLEDENRKLKRLLADAMLDNAALKDLLRKNVWSASSVQGFAISQMTIPVA
ncbi:hypothetical protein Brsp01_53610 [Brucella sp. NBRC 12950]|nr:hypothetical protein Brsp01_53610 [Brucella sp. NBRC 12950]